MAPHAKGIPTRYCALRRNPPPSGLRSTQFAILAEIVDREEGQPTLNQLPTTSYWTARDSGIRFARLSARV